MTKTLMKKELLANNYNIFNILKEVVNASINREFALSLADEELVIETPKDPMLGDFSSNVAFILKGRLDIKNPKEIAEKIVQSLKSTEWFERVEVAGAGFINITLKPYVWIALLELLQVDPTDFGKLNCGSDKNLLLEFVSANPTGPIHVGHTRGAVFGDALGNILENAGYHVVREYLINDAGSQVESLIKSTLVRYRQLFGSDEVITEGMYPGDYIIEAAKEIRAKYDDKFMESEYVAQNKEELRRFIVDYMMLDIKADLQALGVEHDQFISEKLEIQDAHLVEKAFELLKDKGFIELGALEMPKGHDVQDWKPEEQWLFKSTKFGDDSDRPVMRKDGSYTYLAGDLGLAYNRISANPKYDDVIMVLGADHIGYVRRIKALYQAISDNTLSIDIPCVQIVNLYKDGQPFKMSKRAGTFVTAKDVIDEVGKDILRFVMLTRKNDTVIDFDLDKVKEQSKDNPVFYVQYAHARACSALRTAKSELGVSPDIDQIELITLPEELNLIKKIAHYPRVMEQAALYHEPHRVIYYIIELATEFHSFWAKGSDNAELRFIIPENHVLTSAKLILPDVFSKVIAQALNLLGIKALDRM